MKTSFSMYARRISCICGRGPDRVRVPTRGCAIHDPYASVARVRAPEKRWLVHGTGTYWTDFVVFAEDIAMARAHAMDILRTKGPQDQIQEISEETAE